MPNLSGLTTNFFATPNEGFTTTASAPVDSSSDTVIGFNSVSGLTNGSIFTGLIDPGNAKERAFTGVVDTGGSQITSVVFTTGTNATHTTGATIVDYVTGTHFGAISKGLLVDHNQDGSHAILTDANGNEWLQRTSTTNAVNHINIANGATGNRPTIASMGDDAAGVGLDISVKGSAGITLWSDTKTAELAKFVRGGASAVNELSLTSNVTGSGPILSATGSDTNIDLIERSKGTGAIKLQTSAGVALATFSQTAGDIGGEWASWTPTWTNFTAGSATIVAKYCRIGKTVHYSLAVTLSGSTMGTGPIFTLPVTTVAASGSTKPTLGILRIEDAGTTNFTGIVQFASTTTATIVVSGAASTYANLTSITSTVPMTWANSDWFVATGTYEAA